MTSTLPPLVQAFSGAVGSASANLLAYPLDLATTRIQLDNPNSRGRARPRGINGGFSIIVEIAQKYGVGALFDGVWSDTGATLLSNFFYFYFYSFLRSLSAKRAIGFRHGDVSAPRSPHKPTLAEELVLGFLAGVASRSISMPLNIITLKLQTDREDNKTPSTGITTVIKRIYSQHGLAGFWRGFRMTTILSLNPSLTLTLFQLFRRLLALSRRPALASGKTPAVVDPKPSEAFIGAAISNSIAVVVLYPLILAKTRLQASSSDSLTDILADVYSGSRQGNLKGDLRSQRARKGLAGLYQGLEMQILKGFVSQGLTFLVKGRMEQMIVDAYVRRVRAKR